MRKLGRPPVDPDTVSNPDFLYEGPGYFIDRTGERWLVGEDEDGDLVGINVFDNDPQVHYWDPCGRVLGARGHPRDLVGPHLAKRSPNTRGKDLARKFHRSS